MNLDSDIAKDLLLRATAAAQDRSHPQARALLEALLSLDPPVEHQVEAWRCLATIAESPTEQREYIGKILAVDPTDGMARRALAVLEGRLDPDDIIDTVGGTPTAQPSAPVTADRLACPQCGSGRMVAGPSGRTVVCSYCGYQQQIPRAFEAMRNADFAAMIWTARGHCVTAPTYAFVCDGCGASFIEPPGVQSLTCTFCGSVHVRREGAARDLIEPSAIVPFGVAESDALEALRAVDERALTSSPAAIFLPIWIFTFAGELSWKGFENQQDGYDSRKRRVPVSGTHTVIEHSVRICASGRIPDALQPMLRGFDLTALVPFAPHHLAGHATATYTLSLDEASVPARRRALEALREEVAEDHPDVAGLEVSAGRFGVDSFRLVLLPFWTLPTGEGDSRGPVFVNGQTGEVGRPRTRGLLSWLSGLVRRLT